MGDMRNAYSILVEKPEGKIQLRRPGRKWDDNIKMDFMEIVWKIVKWFIWLRIGTSDELL
jgi:hypothetical protein